jgi:hypothetical protein
MIGGELRFSVYINKSKKHYIARILWPCAPSRHQSRKNARCKENPIYFFPEKKLRGLSPNFHIHVSVSDLHCIYSHDRSTYLPAAERQTDGENT